MQRGMDCSRMVPGCRTEMTARFIEPMLLLRPEKLPEGADWLVELKLDGYRALAIKSVDADAG